VSSMAAANGAAGEKRTELATTEKARGACVAPRVPRRLLRTACIGKCPPARRAHHQRLWSKRVNCGLSASPVHKRIKGDAAQRRLAGRIACVSAVSPACTRSPARLPGSCTLLRVLRRSAMRLSCSKQGPARTRRVAFRVATARSPASPASAPKLSPAVPPNGVGAGR
jgi:hypothetical protein